MWGFWSTSVREAAYPHTMGCGTGRRAHDLAGRWMRYGKVAQDMDLTVVACGQPSGLSVAIGMIRC